METLAAAALVLRAPARATRPRPRGDQDSTSSWANFRGGSGYWRSWDSPDVERKMSDKNLNECVVTRARVFY